MIAALQTSMKVMIACVKCQTPAAEVQGDRLVIEHKHHGQIHRTALTLSEILDKMSVTISE